MFRKQLTILGCALALGLTFATTQAAHADRVHFRFTGGSWSHEIHRGWHRYWGGPEIGFYFAPTPVYIVDGYDDPDYYTGPDFWYSDPSFGIGITLGDGGYRYGGDRSYDDHYRVRDDHHDYRGGDRGYRVTDHGDRGGSGYLSHGRDHGSSGGDRGFSVDRGHSGSSFSGGSHSYSGGERGGSSHSYSGSSFGGGSHSSSGGSGHSYSGGDRGGSGRSGGHNRN